MVGTNIEFWVPYKEDFFDQLSSHKFCKKHLELQIYLLILLWKKKLNRRCFSGSELVCITDTQILLDTSYATGDLRWSKLHVSHTINESCLSPAYIMWKRYLTFWDVELQIYGKIIENYQCTIYPNFYTFSYQQFIQQILTDNLKGRNCLKNQDLVYVGR